MAFRSNRERQDADTIWDRVAKLVGFVNGFSGFSSIISDAPSADTTLTTGTEAVQDTIDRAPRDMRYDVTVQFAAESIPGLQISGLFGGPGIFYLEGSTSNVTPTTGVAAGTAGAGTDSTSLVKPTGAANWTAGDLVGYLVKVTAGGGASDNSLHPTYGVVTANSTTVLTVNIPGLDDTSVFQIVVPTTIFTAPGLTVSGNRAPVVVRGVTFLGADFDQLVNSLGNQDVTLDGCILNVTEKDVVSLKDSNFLLKNCAFSEGAGLSITKCENFQVQNVSANAAGQIGLLKCGSGSVTGVVSVDAPGAVLNAVQIDSLEAEVLANDGAATPIYLESIRSFTAVGTNLLTGTGNTGYGIEIAKDGRYTLTGSDITGVTGDVLFMARATTWANLSNPSFGIVEEHAASAVANASYTKSIKYGNVLFMDNVDISGRLVQYGYSNVSANLVVPTLTGNQVLDMEAGTIDGGAGGFGSPRSVLEVICNSATATVNLPSNAAIAGHTVTIANRGSQAVNITSTGGSIIGTATVAAGAAIQFLSLNGAGGKDYIRIG